MTLQLSRRNESLPALLRETYGEETYQRLIPELEKIFGMPVMGLDPHREFYGKPNEQMPLLVNGKDEEGKVIDVPRKPFSVAYIIERRMDAPKGVKDDWHRNYFVTGDSSVAGPEGDGLIILDDPALREITPESPLYNGALVLPNEERWHELKSQVIRGELEGAYFTAQEIEEAHRQGYVNKNGMWVPANNAVGKAWDTLNRGRDPTEYVQLVSEESPHTTSFLNMFFNRSTNDGKPTTECWIVVRTDNSCDTHSTELNYSYGRLGGLAPEIHITPTQEKKLEALLQSALPEGSAFDFND